MVYKYKYIKSEAIQYDNVPGAIRRRKDPVPSRTDNESKKGE